MKRLALLAALLASPSQAAEPVRIGVLLSYSGPYAALGEEITGAMQLAFDQAGNEVEGRRIEVIRADTEAKPNIALSKARGLVGSDHVDLLVGPTSSAESVPLRDFVVQQKMPLLLPNAAADQLTGEKCSPFIIRLSYSGDQFAKPMAGWLVAHGMTSVSTLAPDYVGPRQMMDSFSQALAAAGGRIVRQEFTPFGQTNDYAPYLARIKQDKPDALFVFYAGAEAINFIKQAADFRMQDAVRMTGPGWIVSPLVLGAEGPAAVGFTGLINYTPALDNPQNRAFQAAFQAKFHRVASEFGAQGFETGLFILAALRATHGDTSDREAFARAVRAVRLDGPRGPLSIDPVTNNIVQNMYVVQVEQGAAGPDLTVVDTLPAVRDLPNGCKLQL